MQKFVVFFLIALGFVLSFSSAQAVVLREFNCRSTGNLELKKPATIAFTLKQLASGRFALFNKKKASPFFKVSPAHSKLDNLNKNTFLVQDDKNKLIFWGDKEGSAMIYMTLYKDAHYRTGYVRIEGDSPRVGNHYSKVSCQIAQK